MLEYILVIIAYLLGSVPAAIPVARLMGLPDPRTTGSYNPGATNILRYGGKRAAVWTLLGDVLKSVVAVLLVRAATDGAGVIALSGLAVFIGHLYPIFFGFRGGKGVATALGVWLALSPWVGLALLATWVLVAVLFRYSSLAALSAAILAPVYVWLFVPNLVYLWLAVTMSALLIFRHRENIGNLLAGKEGRIGAKPVTAKAGRNAD